MKYILSVCSLFFLIQVFAVERVYAESCWSKISNFLQPKDSRIVLFLGPPAAGKGTLSRLIAKEIGAEVLSVGDALRSEIERETSAGLRAKEFMERGELAPRDILLEVLENVFSNRDLSRPLFLDGSPRHQDQLADILTILEREQQSIHLAFVIDVDWQTAVDRIQDRRVCPDCKSSFNRSELEQPLCPDCDTMLTTRSDDQVQILETRWATYQKETLPVIHQLEDLKLVRRIDGRRTLPSKLDLIRFWLQREDSYQTLSLPYLVGQPW